jgi:hypothetical protein
MSISFFIRDANVDDAELIGDIARKVWPVTYGHLLLQGKWNLCCRESIVMRL